MIVDGMEAVLTEETVTLPDGDTGYFQRTVDGCLTAALATLTQTPLDDLPPIRNDADALAWAVAHGWAVDRPPDPPLDRRRWIAFTPRLTPLRHTVVFAYDRPYFDPASGWEFPGGARPPTYKEFDYGLTLERMS